MRHADDFLSPATVRTAQASFGGSSDAWRNQTPRSLEEGSPWSAGLTGSVGGEPPSSVLFGLQRAPSLGSLQSASLGSGSSRGSSELYVYGAAQPMSDAERHTLYLEMVRDGARGRGLTPKRLITCLSWSPNPSRGLVPRPGGELRRDEPFAAAAARGRGAARDAGRLF